MDRPEFLHEYDLDSLVLVHPKGRNFSMYVTPRYRQHYEELPFEQFSADLVCKLLGRIRLFIDVGAHYGFYALMAGKQNAQLEVLAFEPTPETCRVLEKNVWANSLNNVTVHQVAISDRNGSTPFNVSLSSDSCGFHANPQALPLRQIDVVTKTLDELLAHHPQCPTLIKIDTEGHEVPVLRGLSDTMRRFGDLYLLVEYNPLMQEAAGYSEEALLEQLEEMGYTASFIEETSGKMTLVESQAQLDSLVKARGYANLSCARRHQKRKLLRAGRSIHFCIDSPQSWKLERRDLTIQGWCLGKDEIVIQSVRARRGKHIWNARLGLSREDVISAFPNDPMALGSGFEVEVKVPILPGWLTVEAKDQYGRWHVLASRVVSRWRRLLKPTLAAGSMRNQKDFTQTLSEIPGRLRFDSCVLAVSHSDYRIAVGGTQKLLQQEQSLLADRGISYLEIHPASQQPVLSNGHHGFLMGVYLDEQLLGNFTLAQMRKTLATIQQSGIRILAVHLHHLMGFDLELIDELLSETAAPKTVFIHDFYTVCRQWNLLKNDKQFCGGPPVEAEMCRDCKYAKERPGHFRAYRAFFEKWKPDFVVPSPIARDTWINSYPELAGNVRIIPHQIEKETDSELSLWSPTEKMRIAFVGYQHPIKGWEEWKRLVASLGSAAYEFFVLGSCSEFLPEVQYVQVSFIEQGPDAMTHALQKEGIELAFLWSLVPETYCFTVFEAMAAGCFVLTNPHSGNIAARVTQTGRGYVAKDFNELVALLRERDKVKGLLEQFHARHRPIELWPNPQLADELAARSHASKLLSPASTALASGKEYHSPGFEWNGDTPQEMVFFTSITSNYLPKAAVLAKTLRHYRPGAAVYVILCDTPPAGLEIFGKHFDRLFLLKDLRLPVVNLEQWIFKHSLVELCTAVKGPLLVQVLEKLRPRKVVYLDPDIVVLDDLRELEALLDQHAIVVTPHLLDPEDTFSAILDNEVCALKHGVFNLGFIGVSNNPAGQRFAKWWSQRLMQFCYDDIANGLFTDQRWMDLAPTFFPELHILRDKTYNVATWNLSQRKIAKSREGRLCIDGRPVKFFHFSGFDSGAQWGMLQKYGRHSPALFELRDWYIAELKKAGQHDFGSLPWGYDRFSNGKPILLDQRRLYRNRPDLMQAFPMPATVHNGERSFYRWCFKHAGNGSPLPRRLPLLKRWERSIKKRVKFLSRD